MSRELAYDLTHLMHRAAFAAPSGIEKVDLAFAEYVGREKHSCLGVHYGYGAPIVLNSSFITSAVARVQDRWKEELRVEADSQFSELRNWLINGSGRASTANAIETHPQKLNAAIRSLSRRALLPFSSGKAGKLPEGAVYLNIAQHALETSIYFKWMLRRRDVQKVFFIHDLLPLDHSEFWPAEHLRRFERRITCATDNGTAFITSSDAVSRRLRLELIERGRPQAPILSCRLPPPNKFLETERHVDRELQGAPYFVAIGTLEPRKNYAFLLHLWNELSRRSPPPKLVIVGKNGWASEEIVGLIRRCKALRGCVIRVAGLASASLKSLVVNSRAVLFPSFAEGFGLPIVEALSAGVPVVASDSDVVREVSQGCANYQSPVDGRGWLTVIDELSKPGSSLDIELRGLVRSFVPMTTDEYFGKIEQFLESLPH